ncbi:MAG: carbamoyl phosphate synthase small subunit, partial [Thermodesulfatator sp.]
GRSFTGDGETEGELVFNTSMTGYQEILTDPSYKGQIVTMTYPLIGNYGVNPDDEESLDIHMSGFVVREYEADFSNWRATGDLAGYLRKHGILGIEEVDTRAVTRHIRLAGAMRAVMSTRDLDPESLVKKAKAVPSLVGWDLASGVSCTHPYVWEDGKILELDDLSPDRLSKLKSWEKSRFRVAIVDCGLKFNQLRLLNERACQCVVFPAQIRAEQLLACEPDGIFISNGPGDPAAVVHVVETARNLIGQKPIFGICLGHQILSLALGGTTYKLKFGHRGGNQPVKDLETGKIEITAQNHGFAVDDSSLPSGVEVTHINLNDQTVEGIRHRALPLFSVQYHPENAPGPHDSEYLFDRFISMMAG